MMSVRKCFRFSLRGFLVALTIGCLWLGWTVDRARRRGRAIDAIVAAGPVFYMDSNGKPIAEEISNDHFWIDLRRTPLFLYFEDFDAEAGRLIAEAAPIHTLMIGSPVDDDALQYLTYLNDGCEVVLYRSENVSKAGLEDLKKRLPNIEVILAR